MARRSHASGQRAAACGGTGAVCERKSALARRPASSGDARQLGITGFGGDFSRVPVREGRAAGDATTGAETGVTAAVPQPQGASCDRPLTWRDFPGPAPAGHGAVTTWQMTLSGGVIRLALTSASGVREQERKPYDRTVNGCGPHVAECETWFKTNNGTFSLGPASGCAAAFSPDTSLVAKSAKECDTILGVECDRVAALNSERLLKHEQYHWSLGCLFTDKGNAAIAAGADANAAFQWAFGKATSKNAQYDVDSNHGCNESGQVAWEAAVDAGMPNETFVSKPKGTKKPPAKAKPPEKKK